MTALNNDALDFDNSRIQQALPAKASVSSPSAASNVSPRTTEFQQLREFFVAAQAEMRAEFHSSISGLNAQIASQQTTITGLSDDDEIAYLKIANALDRTYLYLYQTLEQLKHVVGISSNLKSLVEQQMGYLNLDRQVMAHPRPLHFSHLIEHLVIGICSPALSASQRFQIQSAFAVVVKCISENSQSLQTQFGELVLVQDFDNVLAKADIRDRLHFLVLPHYGQDNQFAGERQLAKDVLAAAKASRQLNRFTFTVGSIKPNVNNADDEKV
jgi:hypothetical protein